MINQPEVRQENETNNQMINTLELIHKIAAKIDGAAQVQIYANDTRSMAISVLWKDGYKFSHMYTKELLKDSPETMALDAFIHYANQSRKSHLEHQKTV